MGHQCSTFEVSKPILAIQNEYMGAPSPQSPVRLLHAGRLRTKILFLDVDGVLHPAHSKEEFIQPCVFQLCRIVQATRADIVLSTAWRLVPMAKACLEAQMATWGLQAPIDATPEFPDKYDNLIWRFCGIKGTVRPGEIAAWLACNADMVDFPRWVAIDDIDMTAELRPHMVKTNKRVGLTQKDADRAIRKLNSQEPCECELCTLDTRDFSVLSSAVSRERTGLSSLASRHRSESLSARCPNVF